MRTHTFPSPYPTWPLHAIDPRGFTPWEHEPDEFDRQADEDFEDFDEEFDCHMGRDGQCGAAGSEDCGFECPVMRSHRAPAHSRWNALSGDVG